MELDASLYWLALSVTPGLAARLTARLLRHFGSREAVFRASLTELEACNLPAAVAQAIQSQAVLKAAEKELAQVKKLGCRLVNWDEGEYPRRLLEIYDPPPLLYLRGDPSVLSRHSIAIVGTRRPTPYGNQMAERLARDLAERGLVIVSGLARGVDSSAHKGACAAVRGATIGVLGNGMDIIYPKENKKLFEQVAQRGAIITEFPLGFYPAPENFPVRNRIVAGMPLGVVVVEGAQYSGSLITARLAMEFSREVYGVPGNATQPTSFAPNQLIKQGAKLVTNWEDVVEELPTEVRTELFAVEQPTAEERASLFEQALSPIEKKLYDLLSTDAPRHVDELVERSELNSSVVLAALFELEMKGIVRQMPGKQFVKVLL
ncbi:MAG TPA: DNA-processing protein DprA [Candidatus Acidoferrales bacterium]|nr:DNA-processing protein DprA [Candidatus Acidoferrales bacterium]